ncbi:hypothetical protein B0O79_0364 [Flavobacteriaceae bacterium MAR_2009_75]|nr:hypothetical protein B0O79_0364 [Flavobacteriaceae bacterium MAR_2009_75]
MDTLDPPVDDSIEGVSADTTLAFTAIPLGNVNY